ncbi:MAG: EamA family transporter [Proteobacteria bacterium]|nr:EamA family transporter [Pseudomonadota bacterium]
MSQYGWFVAALGAAMLWGASYAVSEKVLRLGFSPAGLLVFNGMLAIMMYGTVMWVQNGWGTFKVFQTHPHAIWWLMFVAVLNVSANFMIFYSIGAKNATLASLIEISYPLFTAFFVWLLFRQVQFNWTVAAGAFLIFSGIVCVFVGSRSMPSPLEMTIVPDEAEGAPIPKVAAP